MGHPLMQVLASQVNLPHPLPQLNGQAVIALLPGSRKQEIEKMLPMMLSVAAHFPNEYFAVAQAPARCSASESLETVAAALFHPPV